MSIKDIIVNSGPLIIWLVFVGTLFYAIDDHKNMAREIRVASGGRKKWNVCKLCFLWALPLMSLIGAIGSEWASEASDTRISHLESSQHDPLNEPIANASAVADLVISQNPRPMYPRVFSEGNPVTGWRASIAFLRGTSLNSNVLLTVEAVPSDVFTWNMGSTTNREWRIQFHENRLNFLSSECDRDEVLVKHFDEVNALILSMPFETNMNVESGSIMLTVNNFKWRFNIPRQRPKWGVISMTQTEDSSGNVSSSVLRVPIKDWVIPPRFTNRWYDGL